MNADVRCGVGILYLKGTGPKPLLDIMFASTGVPSAAQAPVSTRGLHLEGHDGWQ